MAILEAWQTVVMRRYAQFDGRAGRAEFWWFALANFIIQAVLSVLGQATVLFTVVGGIYALAVLIPSLAVGIRRLHDIGRSGWWVLIVLIPFAGAIVLIVFAATASQPGANQYGIAAPPFPQLTGS